MRIPALCLSALAFVVLSGCTSGTHVEDEAPGSTQAAETPSPGGTPETTAPSSTAAGLAREIRVTIRSHCGVRSAWVRGELWLASPPLGGHNPPPGWGENQTSGVFVITAHERGVFRGDAGQTAHFRLAGEGVADPNAGCE